MTDGKETASDVAETRKAIRVEEYKSLRVEIDYLGKDARALEIYVLGGLVAFYSWMASACFQDMLMLWLMPILLPLFGGWRSYANMRRIMQIAKHLRGVEAELGGDGEWRGWETRIADLRREPLTKILQQSHSAFWLVLLMITIVVASNHRNLANAACKAQSRKAADSISGKVDSSTTPVPALEKSQGR